MTSPQAILNPALNDPDRALQVEQIVAATVARRASGERVPDAQLIAEHPGLAPHLADALRTAADVRRACLAARHRGTPAGAALEVLSDDELDAPIADLAADVPSVSTPVMAGYAIVSELPRGGQATVYLAMKASTGRRVAVKVLADGRFATARARRRFDREVDVLAALDHPHLVSVIDAGTTADGAPFLVMPYVDGRSLDEFLGDPPALGGLGGADAGPVLELFERLARAIQAAHAAGVIHRDLKPSNIRVDRNGQPQILDFGLARLSEVSADALGGVPATLTRDQILGTPAWMSPEQAAGAADQVDGRADIYALGVMLYQALAARSPYPEENPSHRLLAHVLGTVPAEPSRSPTARRGVDRRVDAVVLTCLAKDPDARYSTAADLAEDLGLCRAGGRPLALVDYAVARAPRPRRLGAWLWATTAATVAVAAAVWEGVGLGLLGVGRSVFIPPSPSTSGVAVAAPDGRRPRTYLNAGSDMAFAEVQPAEFQAGGPDGGRSGSPVVVADPFWIGLTEVTRRQYATIMGLPTHKLSMADGQLPVADVTRAEASEFCRALGRTDHHRYRLPTVGEWELAARCGTNAPEGGRRYGPAVVADGCAWFLGNSGGHAHPVGEKPPSPFTLWDMNGNVAEWCADPNAGPASGIVCGGAFDRPAERCANGARETIPVDQRRPDVGFRVVMEAEPKTPPRK